MKFGLVGLPNVGKSTLFNAILGREVAKASNFPFCTIDPNIAYAEVEDKDLEKLSKLSKSSKTIFPTIQCVDIAGLVKGASEGLGLGNQFLSNIRQVDLILHVVRCFDNEEVIHVDDRVNPFMDAEVINFEIIMSDLHLIQKLKANRKFKSKFSQKQLLLMDFIEEKLKNEEFFYPHMKNLKPEDVKFVHDLGLITSIPMIYVANGPANNKYLSDLDKLNSKVISVDAANDDDITKLVQTAYSALDLITFYTTGPKETRGWPIRRGTKAIHAAGTIHSDFVSAFIMAKVCAYSDYISGKTHMRNEGRDYIVKHQDICHFNLRK